MNQFIITIPHIAFAMLCLAAGPGHALENPFTYTAARAPAPGTLWHYTKSARDGTDPWHVDLYFASPTRIEVVKWLEGASDFVEVHADLDPQQGMASKMSQWNTAHGRREPKLSMTQVATSTYNLTMGEQQLELKSAHSGPIHVWGFDMMAIAYLLPHLEKPGQSFQLNMIDPNRADANGAVLIDTAEFTPEGVETIDGVITQKYRIGGPVFGKASGHVWVANDAGRMERVEHSTPSSTDWLDLKLEFESATQMNGVAWEQFKLKLADAQGGSKGPAVAAKMQQAYKQGGVQAALQIAAAMDRQRADSYLEDLDVFGQALLGFERHNDAIKVYAHATTVFPKSTTAWESLAHAQTAAEQLHAAKASYRQLLKLDPKNAAARKILGK